MSSGNGPTPAGIPGPPVEEAPRHAALPAVPFREAFRTWVRVGLLSFGGPASQIAVMHRILVEEKRWVAESQFLHALNYCMLLPGPEAQQLATYIGWLLHRIRGGLVAGIMFVLPGFVSILLLSILYAGFQDTTLVQALFFGLKPAVVAIVVQAVLRIGGRALKNRAMITLAAAAFVAIFFFEVPFPLIVLAAGLVGYLGSRVRPDLFLVIRGHAPAGDDAAFSRDTSGEMAARPSWNRSLRVAAVCLVLWWVPVGALALLVGTGSIWVQEGVFFSQAAVVTFGGAYAVLAYIAQQAVETYGWLQPGEMLDGLGMAETTPGPLIQVVQFVGFMGAYRNPGGLDPMLAGVLGSVLTTWVTFVPCFLFIFVGAPWIEHLRGRQGLTAALSGITAAVVGVILNLAIWFSIHVLFAEVGEVRAAGIRLLVPEWATLEVAALLITIGSFIALFVLRWGMIRTLLLAAAAGLAYGWLGWVGLCRRTNGCFECINRHTRWGYRAIGGRTAASGLGAGARRRAEPFAAAGPKARFPASGRRVHRLPALRGGSSRKSDHRGNLFPAARPLVRC